MFKASAQHWTHVTFHVTNFNVQLFITPSYNEALNSPSIPPQNRIISLSPSLSPALLLLLVNLCLAFCSLFSLAPQSRPVWKVRKNSGNCGMEKRGLHHSGQYSGLLKEKKRERKCVRKPKAGERGEIRRKHNKWSLMRGRNGERLQSWVCVREWKGWLSWCSGWCWMLDYRIAGMRTKRRDTFQCTVYSSSACVYIGWTAGEILIPPHFLPQTKHRHFVLCGRKRGFCAHFQKHSNIHLIRLYLARQHLTQKVAHVSVARGWFWFSPCLSAGFRHDYSIISA